MQIRNELEWCRHFWLWAIFLQCVLNSTVCIRINDPQKHKVLYTWQLHDDIINYQYVEDLLFLRIINSKLSELSKYYNSL